MVKGKTSTAGTKTMNHFLFSGSAKYTIGRSQVQIVQTDQKCTQYKIFHLQNNFQPLLDYLRIHLSNTIRFVLFEMKIFCFSIF